jgi:predicted acetyltransferase
MHDDVRSLSLRPAAEAERAALENLVQLYCHDWSELTPLDVGADGRYAALALGPYWTDSGRHALLLRLSEKLAGFALVAEHSHLTGAAGVFDMAEFFVLRAYRRQGIGLAAAHTLFDRFRGPWEVRQRDENVAATAFWRRAIGAYTGDHYTELRWNGPEWTGLVQRFSTG